MREITTAEVRPDASKSACFRACATLTGCYDCQPRTLLAMYRCRRRRKGRPWRQTIGNPRNVGQYPADMIVTRGILHFRRISGEMQALLVSDAPAFPAGA